MSGISDQSSSSLRQCRPAASSGSSTYNNNVSSSSSSRGSRRPILTGVVSKLNDIMTFDIFACGAFHPQQQPSTCWNANHHPTATGRQYLLEIGSSPNHPKSPSAAITTIRKHSIKSFFDHDDDDDDDDDIKDNDGNNTSSNEIEVDTENSLRPTYDLYRV